MLQNAILDTLLIAFSNFDISGLRDTQHEYNWQTFFFGWLNVVMFQTSWFNSRIL